MMTMDYVFRWKPHYRNVRDDVLETIQFLTEFEWIQCTLTPEYIQDIFYDFA